MPARRNAARCSGAEVAWLFLETRPIMAIRPVKKESVLIQSNALATTRSILIARLMLISYTSSIAEQMEKARHPTTFARIRADAKNLSNFYTAELKWFQKREKEKPGKHWQYVLEKLIVNSMSVCGIFMAKC